MEYRLANEVLQVGIKRKGAELCSLKTLHGDFDYMWQAEPAVWARHAPILFPIVGKLRNNAYQHHGKEYHLPQHGFARDMDFESRQINQTEASFRLVSSDATRVNYPFDFILDVGYHLEGSKLHTSWRVENTGKDVLPFSIGAHPGFNLLLEEGQTIADYSLHFEQPETASLLGLEGGLLAGVRQAHYLDNSKLLPLSAHLFDDDALVFEGLKSRYVDLAKRDGSHLVRVSLEGFDYLGIWSKPGQPFVCIEPWCGVADSTNATGQLIEKLGLQLLPAGGVFEKQYTIGLEQEGLV
jgi:galactose mutarotase-like enzyme